MRDTTPPLDVSLLLSWWGEEELEAEEEEDEELREEEDEAETKSELKEGTEDGEEEEMEGIARRFGSNLLLGTRQASPFLADQTWMLPFCQLQICQIFSQKRFHIHHYFVVWYKLSWNSFWL